MKKYFEYVGEEKENKGGVASKFWEITVDSSTVSVRFGKIGVTGQTTEKEFDSSQEALEHAEKLIQQKTKKGYREV